MNMEVKEHTSGIQKISECEQKTSKVVQEAECRSVFLALTRAIGDGRHEFATSFGEWTKDVSQAAINYNAAQIECCVMRKMQDTAGCRISEVTLSVYEGIDPDVKDSTPNHACVIIARRMDISDAKAEIITSNGVLGHGNKISDRAWQAVKLPLDHTPELLAWVTKNVDVPVVKLGGGHIVRPPYRYSIGTLIMSVNNS